MSWTFYGLFIVCIGGAIAFTIRSALYQIQVVHADDMDSFDGTMEQTEESKMEKDHVAPTFSTESSETKTSSGSGTRQVDLFTAMEQGFASRNDMIDSSMGELDPQTPSPNGKCNRSINFNSPDSSLSSHFSDSFGSPDHSRAD